MCLGFFQYGLNSKETGIVAERTSSRCLTNKRGFNETYRELLRMVRFCRNVTCFCWRPVLSDPTGNIKTIQDKTKFKILFTDKVARYVGKIVQKVEFQFQLKKMGLFICFDRFSFSFILNNSLNPVMVVVSRINR